MGLGWSDASLVAPDLIQQPRTPSEVLASLASSSSPVLAIDFSYRFLHLGFLGEFEFFDGKKEWTPPRVEARFDPTPLHADILRAFSFHASIESAAHDAIRLGAASSRPFLAVHLRRNDMRNWANRQHAWPSTESVIAQILELASRFKVSASLRDLHGHTQ